MIKVAIIGYGFVGKATSDGFKSNKVKKKHIDPKLGTKISDLQDFRPNFIFICVPTPMENDGSQNFDNVINVLKDLAKLETKATVILKSTVLPSNIIKAKKICPNILYNPEFLREKFAKDDFINSPMIILGGEKKEQNKVKKLYQEYSHCRKPKYIFTDLISAALVKYTINSFLATKVIFFNQLKEIFDKSNSKETWKNFVDCLSNDTRIGSSHMMVPGPDGKKGFGGACFPKDTNAFKNYAESLNIDFALLKLAITKNNEIRSKYDELDSREREQNIRFKDN